MVRGIPERSIESWLTFFCRLVFRLMVERDRERSLRVYTWSRGGLMRNLG